ncbi:MAG: hypothetical protein ACKVS8_12110 [Phycisphaerales bacterium]
MSTRLKPWGCCALTLMAALGPAASASANPDFFLNDGPGFSAAIADGLLLPILTLPSVDPAHLPDMAAFTPSGLTVEGDELVSTAMEDFGINTVFGYDYTYADDPARGESVLGGKDLRGKIIRFVVKSEFGQTPVVWVKSKVGTEPEKVRSFRLPANAGFGNAVNYNLTPSSSTPAGAGEGVTSVTTDPGFDITCVTGFCIYFSNNGGSGPSSTKTTELGVTVFPPAPGAAALLGLGGVAAARRRR